MSKLVGQQITSGYGKHVVINDVTLTIPEGKITIIIGSNGCGKSTLLRNFTRLLPLKEGEMYLNEISYQHIKHKSFSQEVGLLPQSPLVPNGMKVIDLVSKGRYPHQKIFQPLSETDKMAIQEALHMMNIESLAECDVDTLSGGQRQRVFIAMVLAQQTDVLFLDEPTTFLDIAYQIEILDLLKELNQKHNKTIVMVLHDLTLSARYGDVLIAMKQGSILTMGPPQEVVTEEIMKEVFNVDCCILEDPLYHRPFMIPKGRGFHSE